MAATLRQELEEIERIEAMIANAENRRGTALSEIERHRASFAEKLRGTLAQVENSAAQAAADRAAAPRGAGGGMTSLRQRYANRLNARASTGPRTAAGKARAAQNARKHGLRVPALRDPEKTRNIAELARKLAGPTADAQRFEAACRLVAAQIDLLDIREARLPLLARALEDRAAIKSSRDA